MTFGFKLKSLRGRRVVSQKTLAFLINVDTAYLSRVENDVSGGLPSVETIQKIARALKLTLAEADELYVLANKLPPDVQKKLISKPQLLNQVRRL